MLLSTAGIPTGRLEKVVSNENMATIARDHLTNWEPLRPYLGLNRQQEEEIRRTFHYNYGKQKQECLERWKESEGDKATYGALIEAAETAKNQQLADKVKAMLSRPLGSIEIDGQVRDPGLGKIHF